jgi:hypothetical protein
VIRGATARFDLLDLTSEHLDRSVTSCDRHLG